MMNTNAEWKDLEFFRSNRYKAVIDKLKPDLNDVIPERKRWFYALALTPLENTKVVIIGQDPYPNPQYAMGLAFSVPKNIFPIPHSLFNMYAELSADIKPKIYNKKTDGQPKGAIYCGRPSKWGNPFIIGENGTRDQVCDAFRDSILPNLDVRELRGKDLICWCSPERCHCDDIRQKANHPASRHGDLTGWAKQGVLLLNSSLTTIKGQSDAHKGLGWEELIQQVLHLCAIDARPKVFIAMGLNSQKLIPKSILDGQTGHLLLRTVHPSPLSARRGFFGSKIFSRSNEFLTNTGQEGIQWL